MKRRFIPTWALHEQGNELAADYQVLLDEAESLTGRAALKVKWRPQPIDNLDTWDKPFTRSYEKNRIKTYKDRIDRARAEIEYMKNLILGRSVAYTPNEIRNMEGLPPVVDNTVEIKIIADTTQLEESLDRVTGLLDGVAERVDNTSGLISPSTWGVPHGDSTEYETLQHSNVWGTDTHRVWPKLNTSAPWLDSAGHWHLPPEHPGIIRDGAQDEAAKNEAMLSTLRSLLWDLRDTDVPHWLVVRIERAIHQGC